MPRREGRNRPGWYDRYQDRKLKRLEARAKRRKHSGGWGGTGIHGLHPKHRGDTYRPPRWPKPSGVKQCKCGRRISASRKKCAKCAGVK